MLLIRVFDVKTRKKAEIQPTVKRIQRKVEKKHYAFFSFYCIIDLR